MTVPVIPTRLGTGRTWNADPFISLTFNSRNDDVAHVVTKFLRRSRDRCQFGRAASRVGCIDRLQERICQVAAVSFLGRHLRR